MRKTHETIDLERMRLRGRDVSVLVPFAVLPFLVIPVDGGAMS